MPVPLSRDGAPTNIEAWRFSIATHLAPTPGGRSFGSPRSAQGFLLFQGQCDVVAQISRFHPFRCDRLAA